jgi:exopolysaccharide biosynthesis polyprenyl glycosylphosphotransferase
MALPSPAVALIDLALINAGFGMAWFFRYRLQIGREVAGADYLPLSDYWGIELILTASLLLIYYLNGVYSRRRRQGWIDEVSGITQGALLGIAIMIVAVFYLRPFGYSRLVFVFALVCIVTLLSSARAAERIWQGYLRRKGIGLRRVLVVGEGEIGRAIMQNIVAQPELGLQIVGFVDDEPRQSLGRFQYLGRCGDVARLVGEQDLDEVLIALPFESHRAISDILIACARTNVRFRIVPDFFELSLNRLDVTDINGIPLIGVRESTLRGGGELIKRALDVAVAVTCLAIGSPLMLIIALAIKLDSPGPIFVEQIRVGRAGRNFKFFKFRSMRERADQELASLLDKNEVDGPIFKMKNDPRRTRVGRWIRRFSLDELPQMANVLRGDMSLIGPRPPFPHEVEKYQEWHRRRLEVSPGITGLWQVSGRSELPFDEMALLDIWYIENWSVGLDMKILLRTIPTVLFGYGAY